MFRNVYVGFKMKGEDKDKGIVPGDRRPADGGHRRGRALQIIVSVLRPRRRRRHRRLPPYPVPRRRHLLGVRLSPRGRRLRGKPLSPGPAKNAEVQDSTLMMLDFAHVVIS